MKNFLARIFSPHGEAGTNGAPVTTSRFVPRSSRNSGALRDPIAGWLGPMAQTPAQTSRERVLTQRRAGDLAANDWAAESALSAVTQNAVGTGLLPQASIPAKMLGISDAQASELGKQFEWAFSRWAAHADATGKLDFSDLQVLALRSVLSQGEMLHLAVWLPEAERASYGLRYSLAIQALRPQRLQTPADLTVDPQIRDGIRFSESGRPLSYFIATPQASVLDSFSNISSLTSADFTEVPLRQGFRQLVFHLYMADEEEQDRGISSFAPGISLFRNLSDALNNELVSQVLATSFSVFIATETPSVTPLMNQGASEEENDRYAQIEPGRVYYGDPDQKPYMLESNRPSNNFANFVEIILRAMAASQGIPYETLSKNYSKTNYSSMRAAFNEAWKLYKFYRQWLARNYCQPVWEMVIEEAVLRSYVKLPENAPAFSEARDLWCNCDWRGPARGFVDPVKEIQAIILAIDNGLMTRHEALAERGGDFDEWAEATRAEMKTLAEMSWQPGDKAKNGRPQENRNQEENQENQDESENNRQ